LLWRYRKKWVLNFFLLFSFFLACYLAFTSKHTTYPFNEASHLFYVIVIIGVISLFKWRSIWAFLKRLAFVLRAIIKGIAKGFRFVGRGFTKVNTKDSSNRSFTSLTFVFTFVKPLPTNLKPLAIPLIIALKTKANLLRKAQIDKEAEVEKMGKFK
jgi:glucan phosphoethanolaminetransferase (alkaline phosphatase superfamily)